MVLNAAVQMLREADELKQKILKFNSGTSMLQDRSLWTTQQRLQNVYQKILMLDLDYALDKKVEQDLWNVGFKQQIEALQAISKDRKNPLRSEGQAMLSWVLQAAAGFYLCLLHQICATFKLDLPFRRRASLLGIMLVYIACAVKVWLQWAGLRGAAWRARPQLWPALAHTLSALLPRAAALPKDLYDTVPLPEDEELHGFLPLEEAFQGLKFSYHTTWDTYGGRLPDIDTGQDGDTGSPSSIAASCFTSEPELEDKVRAHRLVALGKRLAEHHPEHFTCET
ncbi:PREDICTED: protein SMG7-like [Papilio polytes]|uniref:protein SMG7-like n=1 Tax=Papilio polytes TaxID=76194 RepID=UPI000675F651|nr:PREDICTED: protein SMG7-like [Papilio polytes]